MFNCYLNSSYCIPLFPGCFSMGYLEKVKLGFEQLATINELILGQLSMLNWLSNLKRSVSKNKYSTASLVPRWKKRNSYTIVFEGSDGTLKIGMIHYFLKALLVEDSLPHHLVAIQELHPHLEEGITAGINVTTLNKELGCHLRPFWYPRFVAVYLLPIQL